MQICFPCTACQKMLLGEDTSSNRWVECPACHRLVPLPDVRQALKIGQGHTSTPLPHSPTTTAFPTSPMLESGPGHLHEKTVVVKVGGGDFELTSKKPPVAEDAPVLDVDLEEMGPSEPETAKPPEKKPAGETIPPPPPSFLITPDEQKPSAFPNFETEAYTTVEILPDDPADQGAAITTNPGAVREAVSETWLVPEIKGGFPATPEIPPEDAPILDETGEAEQEQERRKKSKRKKRLREEAKSLRITSIGLNLVNWASLGFLVGVLALVVTTFLCIPFLGMLAFFALGLLSSVLLVLGKWCCCWVPPKSNSKGLILVSCCLDLSFFGQLALGMILLFLNLLVFAGSSGYMVGILGVMIPALAYGTLIASFVLFFLFLKNFSLYLNESGIAREAMELMVPWLLGTVGCPGLIALVVFIIFVHPPLILFIYMIVFLLGSVWFWWYFARESGLNVFVLAFLWLFLGGGGFFLILALIIPWVRLVNLVGSLRKSLAHLYGF